MITLKVLIVLQVIAIAVTFLAHWKQREVEEYALFATIFSFFPIIGLLVGVLSIVEIINRSRASHLKCILGHNYKFVEKDNFSKRRGFIKGGVEEFKCLGCPTKAFK